MELAYSIQVLRILRIVYELVSVFSEFVLCLTVLAVKLSLDQDYFAAFQRLHSWTDRDINDTRELVRWCELNTLERAGVANAKVKVAATKVPKARTLRKNFKLGAMNHVSERQ